MTLAETSPAPEVPVARLRRFYPEWVLPLLFHPRRALRDITALKADTWLAPILILLVLALARAVTAGPLRQPALAALFSASAGSDSSALALDGGGPLMVYVIPAALAALEVIDSWLAVAALVQLALQPLGGGGSGGQTMNLVAWASLPLALRDGVRLVYFLLAHQLIRSPGLAGWAASASGAGGLFLAQLLSGLDLFGLWQLLLLVGGVQAGRGVGRGKAWLAVGLALALVIGAKALGSWALGQLGLANLLQLVF